SGDGKSLLDCRKRTCVAIHTHPERGGWSGAAATETGTAGTSTVTPDSLAEAVSQKGNKHQVHAVVPIVNAGVTAANDSFALAEDTAKDPGLELRIPSHGNARAETAVPG